jgi:hypothetical protein
MKNLQSKLLYIGTSSETKPTASSIPAGSEFKETDTKEQYIDTGSSWVRCDISDYPYEISIAEGLRSNHAIWYKMGFNPACGASQEDVWGGSTWYEYPSGAMGLEVISTNTSDKAAGVGARTVKVSYLNASFEEKTETVTLDGTTAVATASTDFYRVNHFRIVTVGSASVALGDIDIRHLADSPIYSRILAGFTRARNAVYTIPKNKTLFIQNATFGVSHSAANKYANITLKANYDYTDDASSTVFYPYSTALMDMGTTQIRFDIPLKFLEGTDLRVTASSNGTAAIAIALRGWIESA